MKSAPGAVCGLVLCIATSIHATPVLRSNFAADAKVEGFEHLHRPQTPSASANLPTPFKFPSGVTLTAPSPNRSDSFGPFIVDNGGSDTVVVRAIGPSLAEVGVANPLADPTLDLYDPNGALILSDDDWRDAQESLIQSTGLAPTNDAESAIIRSLTPGNYTAIVRGKDGGTGVALVDVFNLR